MDVLAKSEPDGYSLGLGGIAAHAIAPTLYAKLPFNARPDFTFVTTIPVAVQSARGQSRRAGQVGTGADRALPEETRLAPIIKASGARVD
jgi:hypothetical protein